MELSHGFAVSEPIRWQPDSQDELQQFLRANHEGAKLPVGRGFLSLRGASAACLISNMLNKVIDYPAADMTITVQAGMTLQALDDVLRQHNQRLPIDVPHAEQLTLDCAIADRVEGLGAFGHGGWRDAIIGISAMDGTGRLFSAGGRVVKNVAGYDLCKLLIGAGESLGIITQVTFKLRPRPTHRRFVCLVSDDWQIFETALQRMNTSQTRPVALELLSRAARVQLSAPLPQRETAAALLIGYEGTATECDWQAQQAINELTDLAPQALSIVGEQESQALWADLTNLPAGSPDHSVISVQLRPSRVVEFLAAAVTNFPIVHAHAGTGLTRLHIETASLQSNSSQVQTLRSLADQFDGRVSSTGLSPELVQPLCPAPDPVLQKLLTGIKQKLDPAGVLPPLPR